MVNKAASMFYNIGHRSHSLMMIETRQL